jgi:ribonuclease HI/uncharacterized phage-like protein YoqJ
MTSPTVVYTDGACSGNPGPGGWAWAVPDGPFASGSDKHTTNQRMEVSAVLNALRALDGPVEVVSDSTYVINCFRDRWWEGWLKRGWVNSQKKPVANRDLWEPLIDIVRARNDVTFRWVKGHSGDVMNDLVDQLAVEAGKQQQGKSGERAPASMSTTPAKKTSPSGPEAPAGHLLLVTGHRPPELGGYYENPQADAVRRRLTEIIRAKAELIADLKVVTGLQLGAEQLAAEAAMAARVPFVVVQPYPDQHAKWPTDSQEKYKKLLVAASGEVLLQSEAPKSKQAAGGALARRNAWLARHVQEAVVVWDEKDDHIGKIVRTLQEVLGDTEVWITPPD